MREIKFRAWIPAEKRIAVVTDIDFEIGVVAVEEVGLEQYNFLADSNVVLEQYTGLKDMNGIEIYEGDVVSVDIQDCPGGFYRETIYTGVVKLDIGEGGFFVKIIKKPEIRYADEPDAELGTGWYENDVEILLFNEFGEEDIEDIGNVHQNSELLEG